VTPVATHPEAVPGDDRALRWVTQAGLFEFIGEIAHAPDALQALVDDGTLVRVEVEPAAVLTSIGLGRTWRDEGARVRTAICTALETPLMWVARDPGELDDIVRMAVVDAIAGDSGKFIRSHGGEVELVSVHGGDVQVRLGGACEHCPAFAFTLSSRFEADVRARCPRVGKVKSIQGGACDTTPSGPKSWIGRVTARRG
jgi:Fe-S cluster biogenesis protein NfuA